MIFSEEGEKAENESDGGVYQLRSLSSGPYNCPMDRNIFLSERNIFLSERNIFLSDRNIFLFDKNTIFSLSDRNISLSNGN